MKVDIRHAVEADAEAIAAIWNQIIRAARYSALDTPLTAKAQRQFLSDFPKYVDSVFLERFLSDRDSDADA